ncbi:KAP family P-loop NTPase fold protein [Blastococcus brunescens]|uniref:P-loop NTPase fold protein n=1 Tax=Blastococcus brunescens TaxID=1564165 RepID=A0ABZ1B4C2_9ACTN|nr:P-loop NTPase fold protein [Blastococcus sp. BMG 8361]WRL65636.1 P-loop NTPase fold protein [Blastococcus sp. BMG 8361]
MGFDELVDELVVALTTPNLLPLTVGILGDWGSGKSSLLRITRRELEAETDENGMCPYLCVDFSPWLYEDYEDVKTALMRQVLEACRARATAPEALETVERLGRFARLLGRQSRTVGRLALTAAPAALPLVLGMPDMGLADATTSAVQGVAQAVAPLATDALKDEAEPPAENDEIRDLPAFRDEFKKLIASLDGVDAAVVFVDDLDRCLPETVVDTFEAIRLFLNSPQTAYVVAASREIVESAIDSRYPGLAREDGRGIGHDYLEKMLQFQVSVPPLSPGRPRATSTCSSRSCICRRTTSTGCASRCASASKEIPSRRRSTPRPPGKRCKTCSPTTSTPI